MKSAFRATALLSGSSVFTILLSLASTKVLATVLGPNGYGYYGLLQSFLAVTALLAGMGMSTALVRCGAVAASTGDALESANLRAGAWAVSGLLCAVVLPLLILLRVPLSEWALGGKEHQWAVLLIGVSLCFTMGLNVQNGILNAYHRVEALAAYAMVNSIVNAAINIGAVAAWGQAGVAPAVLLGSVGSWGASRWFLNRNIPKAATPITLRGVIGAVRSLASFGIPFTASTVVGTGIQLGLPILVLHLVDTRGVAFYRAASAISVGYLGFLITAMGQDYYPRVSAVRNDVGKMVTLVHEQYRMVMLMSGPIILGTLALVPILVPIVFSRQFVPTVEILEWQLIGDIFKFSSWTISFAILARCAPSAYLISEMVGGGAMILNTWLGVKYLGIPGLGAGFLTAYAVYYLTVRLVLGRSLPFRETRENIVLMLSLLGAAFVIRMLPATPLAHFRTPIALGLALSFGAYSIRTLWGEYISGRIPRLGRATSAVSTTH